MQDVVISIKGRQTMYDWDYDDVIELITPGKLVKQNDDYIITYKESELTGLGDTETTLHVEPRRVTMTRAGSVFSQMVFEQGRKHLSYYDFGAEGGMSIGVNAHKVNTNFTDNGGLIDVEYAVEIENKINGYNNIKIEVKHIH